MLVAWPAPRWRRKYLVPGSREGRWDKYDTMLREVFSRARDKDIILSALMVPSFVPEGASGIFRTKAWLGGIREHRRRATRVETEYDRLIPTVDKHGKVIPPDPAKRRKRGLPESYRQISRFDAIEVAL